MELHSSASVIPDSQPTRLVDDEIQSIRNEIEELGRRRAILKAVLLSSPSSYALLSHARAVPKLAQNANTLETLITEQKRKEQENIYRMCAGVTKFEACDPDPNAVDGGRILGVRFEIFDQRTRSFIPPYYLLLNRPYPPHTTFSVHRHTIPPCIPLSSLIARYLPLPSSASDEGLTSPNMSRFVRELRRKLVLYHRRKDAINNLRDAYQSRAERVLGNTQFSVKAVDAELKELSIDWTGRDEGAARISMTENGELEKVIWVRGDGKRQTAMERKILDLPGIESLPDFISSEA